MTKITDWRKLLTDSIVSAQQASLHLPEVDADTVHAVSIKYPMQINPYYLSLIRQKDDPIWRQVIPDILEINAEPKTTTVFAADDPFCEEKQSPVPNITHRYPDRVLFLVSDRCGAYCRFCMRKRRIGFTSKISAATITAGIDYIRSHKQIRDVILSGGDPLIIEDGELEDIIKKIRMISHVEIIRIHTRAVCTLPQRITENLVNMLRRYHPIYINTHFNHPLELTPEAAKACGQIADAGIPLGCQTVLLNGVNDDYQTIRELLKGLLKLRVKPYYLHHPDPVQGTCHFRVPIQTGLNIIQHVRGHMSGIGVPHYVIDLPGGGGKIPLLPEYVQKNANNTLLVRNYNNEIFEYPG